MKNLFNKKVVAVAAGLFLSQFAFSQTVVAEITNGESISIRGNSDNNVIQEGVYIRSNPSSNAYLYVDTLPANSINVGQIRMGTDGAGGAASISFLGSAGVINTGTLAITGATNLNTIGAAVTNIGNSSGATNINNGVAGTTNIGTGSAASATNIGNAQSTNTVLGTTNITGVTSINSNGNFNTFIGNANTGTTIQNTIAGQNNSMTATTANNIQGPINNIGTVGASNNTIGNNNPDTLVTSIAGNARQALANNSANTTVDGNSALTARTGTANVPTKGQVLLSNTGGTTVDANGKILTSAATGPTAAVTLTNGYGNTHGLVVTESQTTLSGGTESSSMTLTDRAATFSNAQTGAPITVTGVADGRADFDAVNVRQFAGAIAAVAAQANIPALAVGQDRTFGMGVGNFMGKSALAMGMNIRGSANSVYKATVSSGLNNGMKQTVVGVGGAWGF